jgi:ankyrin repeat protein
LVLAVFPLVANCSERDDPRVYQDDGPRLHRAVAYRDYPSVKRYIAAGDDVNVQYPPGVPLLSVATGSLDLASDEFLLTRNEVQPEPENLPILRLLLEAGADPNGAGGDAVPPLTTALRHGRRGSLALLLLHGADPDFDGPGPSPRCEAIARGDEEALRLMEMFDRAAQACPPDRWPRSVREAR